MDMYLIDRNVEVFYPNPNAAFVLAYNVKDALPSLRAVITPSTGETHIDRASLNKAGIDVRSLLDDREALEEIRASSEFAFLMILNALRRIDTATLGDRWVRPEERLRGHELYNKMVGLVGHGRIGKNLENWCRAFGAGVYWYDPYDKSNVYQPDMRWLFANCSVVVICCSLTEETRGMIDWREIQVMREGAILVNVSRGEVLKENDVSVALASRPDIEFWTDVLAGEAGGDILHSPLLGLSNVHITPHIAGTTFESQEKAARITLELTKRWIDANG
jgi:phosphoglycerate dehydrogenase-like enzyme